MPAPVIEMYFNQRLWEMEGKLQIWLKQRPAQGSEHVTYGDAVSEEEEWQAVDEGADDEANAGEEAARHAQSAVANGVHNPTT